jgi:hypothetical protein
MNSFAIPDLLQTIVLLGGPGLVAGATLGSIVRSWKIRLVLAARGGLALLYGFNNVPSTGDDDDDPDVLVAIAMMMNFGGWVVGLAIGEAVNRVRRSSAAS